MINKEQLAEIISQRLNRQVSKAQVLETIEIICDYILEQLSLNRIFSVENFGTFAPYFFKPHKGYNVSTGEMQMVPGFWSCRFHAALVFKTLLSLRREEHLSEAEDTSDDSPK